MSEKQMKYGRVVIVGRPNTGKSTLINAIMQQKVAITSPLPQTSRKSVRVLFSSPKGKLIISDTPGIINKVEDLVGKRVNLEAPKELLRADVIVTVVDISRPKSDEENKVIGIVRKVDVPKILVYNKIDAAIGSKNHLPEYNYLEDEFNEVVGLSAIQDKHVKDLVNKIFALLPANNREDVVKEAESMEMDSVPAMALNSKEYLAELIREKAYLFLRKEVPYSINVEVDEIKDKGNLILVKATVYTNADRYKKMIIGKGGQKIKEIGFNARKEMELMSSRKVFLELNVAVDRHWQERVDSL